MEDRYPIKFSLGQFILLLGVVLVVVSLIFLLGARFGGFVFPEYYTKQFQLKSQYSGLAPENRLVGGSVIEAPRSNQLVDSVEEEEEEAAEEEEGPGMGAPHFQVDSEGRAHLQERENFEGEAKFDHETLTVNRSLIRTDSDRQTMIRFKSSGHSKFTVEVKDYFDELLASRRISQLKGSGYEAYLHIKNPNSQSPTYSVRVGAFADRSMAEDFATQMSNKAKVELQVVQMN